MTRISGRWRSALRSARAAAVAVVGLLAVAAAGANATRGAWTVGSGADQGRGRVLVELVAAVMALAAAGVCVALVWELARRRRTRPGEPDWVRQPAWLAPRSVRVFAYLAALVAAAVPFVSLALLGHMSTAQRPAPSPNVPVPPSAAGASPPAASPAAGGGVAAVAIVGGAALAVLLVLGYVARRRAGRPTPPPDAPERTQRPPVQDAGSLLAEASGVGQQALSADDPRAAVLACYTAMTDVSRRAGVPARASDVPGELLARAVSSGVVRAEPSRRLTELFGEARFSSHPFGEPHRRAAVAALGEIRSDLTERT